MFGFSPVILINKKSRLSHSYRNEMLKIPGHYLLMMIFGRIFILRLNIYIFQYKNSKKMYQTAVNIKNMPAPSQVKSRS